jgi:hypothetical protein
VIRLKPLFVLRMGYLRRSGEYTISLPANPFGQASPLFTGCSGSPSIVVIFPSLTCAINPQLVWQDPQIDLIFFPGDLFVIIKEIITEWIYWSQTIITLGILSGGLFRIDGYRVVLEQEGSSSG